MGWVLALGTRAWLGAAVDSALPLLEVPTLTRAVARFLAGATVDEVDVIGQALALSIAGGLGMRPVAERLGVPMTTARDWRRRFRLNALMLATALVALAVHLDPAPVLLSAANNRKVALEALGAT
jgi:hypothetical protein